MSNEKTLATAKHGGCVQLGSEERVRFDAWLETISVDTTRWGDGEYTDPYADNYWLAWQAALSAQPSPGGQDALADAARRVLSDVDSGDYHGEISEATYAALEAALAARQPVGVDDATDRALGETIEQRDRCEEVADKLADHIARITGVDIGEHSSANCPWQNAIEAAEEYKPAQAVDLGLQLDRYDAGLLGDGGGGDVGWWQDYIRTELDRAHEFYQDQADSQAVGK